MASSGLGHGARTVLFVCLLGVLFPTPSLTQTGGASASATPEGKADAEPSVEALDAVYVRTCRVRPRAHTPPGYLTH